MQKSFLKDLRQEMWDKWKNDCYFCNMRAFHLKRMHRLQDALQIQIENTKKFPLNFTANYNLACYLCLSNQYDAAEFYLKKAIELNPKMHHLAGHDEDLRAIMPPWSALRDFNQNG
jgi:tetratricopeptide (TPR) repeat protein